MKNSQAKKVIIIGGGPAGLAAGLYCRKAGLDPVVLEKHTLPGGLCTNWKRNGYSIDGCVHFIMGSGVGSPFHEMWKELGVFEEINPEKDFVYHNDFFHFRFADGKEVTISSDLEKIENDLGKQFPEDIKQIKAFTDGVRSLRGFTPPLDLLKGGKNLWHAFKQSFRYIFAIYKWKNITIEQFSSKFKSRELRDAFVRLWYPDYNMLYILLILDWLNRGLAGYPIVTSLGFSKVLEKKLLERGGEIRYNSRVKKIIFDNGRAAGVILDSNENIFGDYIINTASSPWSMNMMLPGINIGKTDYTITPPLVHISYGTSYDFSGYESSACGLQLELNPPIKMAGEDRVFLLIHIYNFTPNLAPEGKTLVKIMFPSDYEYWNKLKQLDDSAYKDEKEKCSAAVLNAMERYFPGFSRTIDMTDIATPVTFYRYTENQNGSLIAWGAVPATPMMLPKTIKGVSNLVLAGHWVMPGGGVPQAAMSARQAVQLICMNEKIYLI